jgi:cytidyltransferase-like protein
VRLLIAILELVSPLLALLPALAFPVVFIPVDLRQLLCQRPRRVRATSGPMSCPEAGTGALGIFGGTFDPIHYGHLRLAETAREALGLEGVRLIPAGQPPHRATPGASGAHRLAMARLAAADNPSFEVDPAEVDRGPGQFHHPHP